MKTQKITTSIQVSHMTKKELELLKNKLGFKRFDSVINYLLNRIIKNKK